MGIAENRFLLSSDECELLLEFESCSSLRDLAVRIGRDHSVVTRSLKRIFDRHPVVEKKSGKWVLTDLGRKINDTTKAYLHSQSAVLSSRPVLRIGTNREFASRVLAAEFRQIQDLFPRTQIVLNSYEQGTEAALLHGQIDIGLDCDRPFDPEVSYRLVVDEPIVAVASKGFIKSHRKEIATGNYFRLPHLLCDRLHPDKILSRLENQIEITARFNDIAAARAACVHGIGWALLPAYAVREEIATGSLARLDEKTFGKSRYGIWWLRSRPYLKDACEKVASWLRSKEL